MVEPKNHLNTSPSEQFERLVNLLVDLSLSNPPVELSNAESTATESVSQVDVDVIQHTIITTPIENDEEETIREKTPQVNQQESSMTAPLTTPDNHYSIEEQPISEESTFDTPEGSNLNSEDKGVPPNSSPTEELTDEEREQVAVDFLQNLLFSNDVIEVRRQVERLQNDIGKLEREIDNVIEQRTRESRESMGEAIAAAIPIGISYQIVQSPEEIAKAIAPEMAVAIREQVALEKEAMEDALYPIIGMTVAKYMAEVLRTINEKLEDALSSEGIKRKIRAKLQGVSEAELLLKESVPFTIRAIFLIHKASGLVISEAQPTDRLQLESDMMAGMLTAIRSFANDCMVSSGDMPELHEINYGNSKIILEAAGYCYLAVVVEGEVRQWFVQKLRRVLSYFVSKQGRAIESFEGDPDTVPPQVHSHLQSLIDKPTNRSLPGTKPKRPPALLLVSLAVLGLIAVPLGMREYRHKLDHRIERTIAVALDSDPELSVYRINAEVNSKFRFPFRYQGTLELSGRVPNTYLQQKAVNVAESSLGDEVVDRVGIDDHIIAVRVPPDPVSVAAEIERLTSTLNLTEGTAIATVFEEGTVSVEGTIASVTEAKKISQAFEQIPGVDSVINTADIQPLTITTQLYFLSGSAQIKPSDISLKIVPIQQFLQQYPEKHLKIIGYSDNSGDPQENLELAQQRAQAVKTALVSQGVNPLRLEVTAEAGTPADVSANQPFWLSRTVEFEVFTPDR